MKIAYIVNHDLDKDDGVTKKIRMQVRQWKKEGLTVRVFSTKANDNYQINDVYFYKKHSRFLLNRTLISDLSYYNPNVIYYRYSAWGRTLSKIVNDYPSVVEVNTNEEKEFFLLLKKDKTIKSLLLYLSNKFLRRYLIKKTNCLIGVTNELAELDCNAKYCKDRVGIPNGIDLSEFKTEKTIDSNSRTGIFFMGTPNQPWHGVDFIEELSLKFRQYDFHIVGIEGEDSSNLFFHGYLNKNDYVKVLKKCHVCVGSLALFRNQMNEGSPLKVREYVAYGYPVLVGYKDSSMDIELESPTWYKELDFSCFNDNKDNIFDSFYYFIEDNKGYILNEADKYKFSSEYTEKNRIDVFKKYASI